MMFFTNEKAGTSINVPPTPPCCAREVVTALLQLGYKPFNSNARAYVQRMKMHVIAVTSDIA